MLECSLDSLNKNTQKVRIVGSVGTTFRTKNRSFRKRVWFLCHIKELLIKDY